MALLRGGVRVKGLLLSLKRRPLAGDLEGRTAVMATAKARSSIFTPWASVRVSEKGHVVRKPKAKAEIKANIPTNSEIPGLVWG